MAKISLMEFVLAAEQRALAEERNKPPKGYPKDKSSYAVPDEYLFPIDDAKHTRAAISMFSKHKFKDEEQKRKAAKRILAAAKRFGIDVSETSDVYKAAHSKDD
jgi:hypothetical protein